MKTISVSKFENLCQLASKITVLLNSIETCVTMSSVYNECIIVLSPNRICFKNEYGNVCLRSVSRIIQLDKSAGSGLVFIIECVKIGDNCKPVTESYTVILELKE